jgi:hypothetical protein
MSEATAKQVMPTIAEQDESAFKKLLEREIVAATTLRSGISSKRMLKKAWLAVWHGFRKNGSSDGTGASE